MTDLKKKEVFVHTAALSCTGVVLDKYCLESMQPIPQEKRMVQSLMNPMVKKMRMSGNTANEKR